jgi:predicted nucleic acid-binding protein
VIVPSSAICDASVVVRWLVDDALSDVAIDARARYDLIAPKLLLSEAGNALRAYVRAGSLPLDLAQRHLIGLPRQIELRDEDRFMPLALRLAVENAHAIYDCVYAATAMTLSLPLITADVRFARKFAAVPDLRLLALQDWTT